LSLNPVTFTVPAVTPLDNLIGAIPLIIWAVASIIVIHRWVWWGKWR